MLPAEKALVQRLANEPFVLFAINSDPADKVAGILKEQGVTWPNLVQGSTDGPVSNAWNVQGWPTIVLLDHEGVIRFRGHSLDEKQVDALVAAAKAAAAPKESAPAK
jgi:hypothetical protein